MKQLPVHFLRFWAAEFRAYVSFGHKPVDQHSEESEI